MLRARAGAAAASIKHTGRQPAPSARALAAAEDTQPREHLVLPPAASRRIQEDFLTGIDEAQAALR